MVFPDTFHPLPPGHQLLPGEVETWLKAQHLGLFRFGRAAYSLHVGRGMEPDPSWDPAIQRMVRALTTRRIDVALEGADAIFIIEIKDRAEPHHNGQLLAYRVLYELDFKPTRPIKLVLLANRLAPDTREVAQEYGIEVVDLSSVIEKQSKT